MIRSSVCILSLLFLAAAGCGTDTQGVDSCRAIEQARCRRAPSCPELGVAGDQVESCVEFTRDQCLHGLAVPDPGGPIVDQCARTIEDATTSCALVSAPENIPACAFLTQSPTPDSGSVVQPDASDTDAGTDGD
jgi:hypothetical protein